MKISKYAFFTGLVFLIFGSSITAQLHPLEPAKNHYKNLIKLSGATQVDRSELDEIIFPPSSYSSGSLIYVLASPMYLTPTEVQELKNGLKFPANSSEQTQEELKYLLDWQERRTDEQKSRAVDVLAPIGYWPHVSVVKNHERYERNLDNLFFEGRTVIGDHVNAANYPETSNLLEGITRDMRIMEFTVKYHLLRPRPYHLEPKLEPLARISSPSFVSGHTLWAYIQAFTWSELIPAKRKEFLQLAYEVGESREIMGIHYPSDEEWARVLAHRMLSHMLDNPKFINDLKKAKAEWD